MHYTKQARLRSIRYQMKPQNFPLEISYYDADADTEKALII